MKTRLLFAIFLLTFVLSAAAFSQTLDIAKLDQFLDALAAKNKAMGSLAIAKEGDVIYKRAVGYSQIDGEKKTPSTVQTRYRIGSISKTFTAVMIFQLIEEGKLNLNDTLDKFFPQIPNAKKITFAQILSHTSGIHSFTSDADFKMWRINPKSKDEILTVIAKSTPDFEPGEKMQYSNAGYIILGYIVEKITGKSYQEALKERITSKIGLDDTYLGGKINAIKNESLSYRYSGEWKEEAATDASIPGGAGAMVSTPADLAKFIKALFDGKLVSQESLEKMKTEKMGMFPFPLFGNTVYGHNGAIDGFNSMVFYLPEEKLAISYVSNGADYPVNDVILGIYAIYSGRPFTIPTFEVVKVSEEILEKYVGVYATEKAPLKITVTREEEKLFAQATGQSAFPLEATDQNKFKFDRAGIVIEFDAEKNQLIIKQGGRETVFTKEK